jgi:hypothetical protein
MVVRALLALFLGHTNNNASANSNHNSNSNLIEGTFQLATAHNFEAYLAELGVNYVLRRLASLANPTVSISR